MLTKPGKESYTLTRKGKGIKKMKLTSRYNHKYNAFLDELYIIELCDTDDLKEFLEIVKEFGNKPSFVAYVDDERVW